MVEGIPYCASNNLSPLHEFVVRVSIPRDESLVDPCAPHQPPLVVISAEPDLCDAVIVEILPDLFGAYVAVVIDDGAM